MKAEGKSWTVTLGDGKLLVERQGKLRLVRQGVKLTRQGPSVLWEALKGPNRNFLLAALLNSKDLLVGLAGSLRDKGAASKPIEQMPDRDLLKVVTDALSNNKSAAFDAFRANDDLVKAWLKHHKELLGIFLEGDIHVFLDDVVGAENDIGWRKGTLSIHVHGVNDPVEIEYDKEKRSEFEELHRLLNGN